MARWVINKGIKSVSRIKNFDLGGYIYSPEQSTNKKPVFLRG